MYWLSAFTGVATPRGNFKMYAGPTRSNASTNANLKLAEFFLNKNNLNKAHVHIMRLQKANSRGHLTNIQGEKYNRLRNRYNSKRLARRRVK